MLSTYKIVVLQYRYNIGTGLRPGTKVLLPARHRLAQLSKLIRWSVFIEVLWQSPGWASSCHYLAPQKLNLAIFADSLLDGWLVFNRRRKEPKFKLWWYLHRLAYVWDFICILHSGIICKYFVKLWKCYRPKFINFLKTYSYAEYISCITTDWLLKADTCRYEKNKTSYPKIVLIK